MERDAGAASNHIILELVANVVDQFLVGRARTIDVTITSEQITVQDVGWAPSSACFHLIMEQPQYAGPTKHKLHAPEIIGQLRNALVQMLGE